MAKKVGGASKGNGEGKPEKEKKARHVYPVPTGGLTEKWPTAAVSGTDYDPKSFKPLKKADFSKLSLFMEYKGAMIRRRAESMLKQAERLEANAKITGNFDAATEKNLKKAKKAAEQFQELMKQFAAQGIDVNKIPGMPTMDAVQAALGTAAQ